MASDLAQARATCAARLREKGQPEEAAAFEAGERDASWAMKHELYRMEAERGAG